VTLPAPFDLAAGLLMLVLAVYGLLKGIVRLVLDVAGLVLGWLLAVRYGEALALRLGAASREADAGPDWHRLAAFALIFLGVTFGMSALAWLITRALSAARLGGLNRLAGAGLGVLAAIVTTCAVTVPLIAMAPPDAGGLLRGSVLAPYAVAGGQYLEGFAPQRMRERFSAGAARLLASTGEADLPPSPAPAVSEPKPAPVPRRR
jgi:membrane protein required for colicin V production